MEKLNNLFDIMAKSDYLKSFDELNVFEMHNVIAKAVRCTEFENIEKSREGRENKRRAYYFSAEFLVGRAIYNNLLSLGLLDKVKSLLLKNKIDIEKFEDIEDAALGNGGLGRLAACFLESAATVKIPVDGYGIRYKYGLFKQKIENGFQIEEKDNWSQFGDPWSLRRESESVIVEFEDEKVKAVPYDMPIYGYKNGYSTNIRLWQSEALNEFDFEKFNEGKYNSAFENKNNAETITSVLYPNDSSNEGKILRLKQEYFFSSASLQDIIRSYKKSHNNYDEFSSLIAISLNDTHPVISIALLIMLLCEDGVEFDCALEKAKKVFKYTNHTVMAEALEKWDEKIIKKVSSKIYEIIVLIDEKFKEEAKSKSIDISNCAIISDGIVNMAHLACYVCESINAVAQLHTEIIKKDVLRDFYVMYPQKFKNVTNGITQRRWLLLSNKELSSLITRLLQSENWITDLSLLKNLEKYCDDRKVLEEFMKIRQDNKKALAKYIEIKDGITINSDFIIDSQIKRLHEYKRQLLNILAILEMYFEIKEGSLQDFQPTVFIFAAKAAPAYKRAKGIIKLINEVSRLIKSDKEVRNKIEVVFLANYDVSYAEKIIAATDISQQISTVGTEASGTGNMKLMLNGAVTLGTFDGANIEIVEEAGRENNYIFSLNAKQFSKIKDSYNPKQYYESDKRIKRCLDALVDGTLSDDGSGYFKEIYTSLLENDFGQKADNYFLLYDFSSYLETRLKANSDYKDKFSFAKKGWLNMCNSGKFSSDRSVKEYAENIWYIE